jgi:DNA-binding NtrC family response regulator
VGEAGGELVRGNVLVIEDDEMVRHLARRTLELDGYQVLEARDGEEGLRMMEEHPGEIDLVLTDIEMPKLDGMTVARVIAAMRPRTAVVCMSGRLPEAAFQARIGLPQPPFLAKPFTFEDLSRTTSETLARFRDLRAWDDARQTVTRHILAERQLVAAVDLITAGRRLRARVDFSTTEPASTRRLLVPSDGVDQP